MCHTFQTKIPLLRIYPKDVYRHLLWYLPSPCPPSLDTGGRPHVIVLEESQYVQG